MTTTEALTVEQEIKARLRPLLTKGQRELHLETAEIVAIKGVAHVYHHRRYEHWFAATTLAERFGRAALAIGLTGVLFVCLDPKEIAHEPDEPYTPTGRRPDGQPWEAPFLPTKRL